MSAQNENGLTWDRWYAAASFGLANKRRHVYAYDVQELRKAWQSGECPCDWAAHLAASEA